MTIRPAVEADQPVIVRLVREAKINPMDLRWPHFMVAEEDRAIVGVGQVKTHRDGSRELASIAVVPPRRGQGIGSALINALLARETTGLLYLTCQSAMRGYYERFGFQVIGRSDYPPYFRRMLPIINAFARLAHTRIVVMRRNQRL